MKDQVAQALLFLCSKDTRSLREALLQHVRRTEQKIEVES